MNAPAPDDLAAVDQFLCTAATVALPLYYLEPTNAAEEKAKVAQDPLYDPQFLYTPQDRDKLQALEDAIGAIKVPSEGVGVFFRQARDYIRARIHGRLHLGQDEHWVRPLYPAAPERVLGLAWRILSTRRPPKPVLERPFHAEDLARIIRARLKQYQLDDWRVVICDNISSTNTDPANRRINLRADIGYTLTEMKRLVVHEVDTHVLRAANGYHQPFHIFAVGAVPSYLMTEEGLAVVNEERMGYIDAARTRMFAARAIAAWRSYTQPFHEIYGELRDHGFSHDDAFFTAKRVKRGLGDTSHPGGFIKDQAYLWGRILVEEFILSGGSLTNLYVGKIALEHAEKIEEMGLRPPHHTPHPYS